MRFKPVAVQPKLNQRVQGSSPCPFKIENADALRGSPPFMRVDQLLLQRKHRRRVGKLFRSPSPASAASPWTVIWRAQRRPWSAGLAILYSPLPAMRRSCVRPHGDCRGAPYTPRRAGLSEPQQSHFRNNGRPSLKQTGLGVSPITSVSRETVTFVTFVTSQSVSRSRPVLIEQGVSFS